MNAPPLGVLRLIVAHQPFPGTIVRKGGRLTVWQLEPLGDGEKGCPPRQRAATLAVSRLRLGRKRRARSAEIRCFIPLSLLGLTSGKKVLESSFGVVAEAPGVLNHFIAHERMQEAIIAATRRVFGALQFLQRRFFCAHGLLIHTRG
jgi:hypothetical protein